MENDVHSEVSKTVGMKPILISLMLVLSIFFLHAGFLSAETDDNRDTISSYGVVKSSQLNFGDGGFAGWSVPTEKVVTSG